MGNAVGYRVGIRCPLGPIAGCAEPEIAEKTATRPKVGLVATFS